MKFFIHSIVLVLLFPAIVPSQSTSKKNIVNKYVSCRTTISRTSFKPGEIATLLVTLTPQKGIHINTVPPITFAANDSASVTLVGNLKYSTVNVDTSVFVKTSKPVTQSFSISKSAKPGSYVLKGTLTYFYCSDAEGWCSKFKQPIAITINVKK